MMGVFGALKTLRAAAGCCRQGRETFRAFFVTAIFCGIGAPSLLLLCCLRLHVVSRFLEQMSRLAADAFLDPISYSIRLSY